MYRAFRISVISLLIPVLVVMAYGEAIGAKPTQQFFDGIANQEDMDVAQEKAQAKQGKQPKPESGDSLRIPPDAAQTGDLSFLEGCWRGTRPEYKTKRIITERFCFGKNGNGKRFIDDPATTQKCTGSAKGSFDAQGRLIVTSERASCTDAKGRSRAWGQAYMVCQGEGNATPYFWRFPDARGGTQNYRIPLVRE